MATRPGEGVAKEEKFLHNRKLSQACLWGSFGISEGNITGREKKQNPQNMCLTVTSSSDACSRQQRVGVEQGGMGCIILRVKTRLECPEDNLKGLI